MLLVHLASADVPVYVRRYPYAGVPQDPPHHLKLGAAPQHLRGVQVPQLVRGERLHARPFTGPLERLLYVVYLRVPRPRVAREHVRGAGRPLLQVVGQHVRGGIQQRHHPPLAPLAQYPELPDPQVDAALPQAHALRQPQPRGGQEDYDRPHLEGVLRPEAAYLQHLLHVLHRGALPLALAPPWAYVFHALQGVIAPQPLGMEEGEQADQRLPLGLRR